MSPFQLTLPGPHGLLLMLTNSECYGILFIYLFFDIVHYLMMTHVITVPLVAKTDLQN